MDIVMNQLIRSQKMASSRINFHPLLLLLQASSKQDVKEIIALTRIEDVSQATQVAIEKLACDERQAQNLITSLSALMKKLNEQEETYEARSEIFPDSFHSKLRDLLIKLTAVRRGSSSRASSVSTGSGPGSDLDTITSAVRETGPIGRVKDSSNLSEEEGSVSTMNEPALTSNQVSLNSSQDVQVNVQVKVQSNVQKPTIVPRIKPPIPSKRVTSDNLHSDEQVVNSNDQDKNASDVDGTIGFSSLLNVSQEQLGLISSFPRLYDLKCELVHEESGEEGNGKEGSGSDGRKRISGGKREQLPREMEGSGSSRGTLPRCKIHLDLIHGGMIHEQEVILNSTQLDQTIERMSLVKDQLFQKLVS